MNVTYAGRDAQVLPQPGRHFGSKKPAITWKRLQISLPAAWAYSQQTHRRSLTARYRGMIYRHVALACCWLAVACRLQLHAPGRERVPVAGRTPASAGFKVAFCAWKIANHEKAGVQNYIRLVSSDSSGSSSSSGSSGFLHSGSSGSSGHFGSTTTHNNSNAFLWYYLGRQSAAELYRHFTVGVGCSPESSTTRPHLSGTVYSGVSSKRR